MWKASYYLVEFFFISHHHFFDLAWDWVQAFIVFVDEPVVGLAEELAFRTNLVEIVDERQN